MGYSGQDGVRAKIVSIVSNTAPTDLRLGAGSRFIHDPTGHDDKPPNTRGFYLRLTGGALVDYRTPTRPVRHACDVELTIAYRLVTDLAVLDEVIEADRVAVSASLLTTPDWNSATTKIDSLSEGAPLLMQTTQVDVEGARLLRFSFPLRYRE